MAVFRVEKNKNYTVMSNYHLKEKNMSLKAKGLLSIMLSLPDNWDYSIEGLIAICKENEKAIKNTLKELQQFGYLKISKLFPNKGNNRNRIQYIYDVYEFPNIDQIQEVQNVGVEDVWVQKEGQLNTNILSTKELNTKEYNERMNEQDFGSKKYDKTNTYEKIINEYTEDEAIKDTIYDFIKMRNMIKAPLTDRALKSILNKLTKLSKDKETQIQILEQSIMNNWRDIFQLREEHQIKKYNTPSGKDGSEYAMYD